MNAKKIRTAAAPSINIGISANERETIAKGLSALLADIPRAVTIESSGRFESSGSIGTVAPWRGWCGYLASSVRWP